MNETTDIEALHDAIQTTLRGHWPASGAGAVPTILCYDRQGERAVSPAVFFELTEITPEDTGDTGTEQYHARLHWSAFIVVAYNKPAAKLAIRLLVADAVAFIRGQRWGLSNVGAAEVTFAGVDNFSTAQTAGKSPNLAYETWRIDWMQEALLGASVWAPGSEVLPTEVWIGWDPRIGPPHIDDYEKIEPVPPA